MVIPKNNLSVVVSAPSGAGKTTIIRRLLAEDKTCEFVISTTTRKPREGEKEGGSYYFITDEAFKEKIKNNEFMEWSLVHSSCYGVTKKEFDRIISIGKIPLFDVDVQGARKLKSKLENAAYIFIAPPSIQVLEYRLRKRGTDNEDEITLRLQNALKELKELNTYDYIVINNIIDEAIMDFKAILRAELCRIKSNSIKF